MVQNLRKEIFTALFATYLGACTVSTSTAEQQQQRQQQRQQNQENTPTRIYFYQRSGNLTVQEPHCNFTEGEQGKYVCVTKRPLDFFPSYAAFEYDASGKLRLKMQTKK